MGTSVLLFAAAHLMLGREQVIDTGFAVLVLLVLAVDIVAPLLLVTRKREATIVTASAALGAVLGAVSYALVVLRPGDARMALLELPLMSLLFLAPAMASLLAAGGSRRGAVAVAGVSTLGMLLVYVQAHRFGAFSWGLPLGSMLQVAMLGFVTAGALAAISALMTREGPRESA